jgi:hypothetical protein
VRRRRSAPSRKSDAIKTASIYTLREVHRQQSLRRVYNPIVIKRIAHQPLLRAEMWIHQTQRCYFPSARDFSAVDAHAGARFVFLIALSSWKRVAYARTILSAFVLMDFSNASYANAV